MPPLVPLLYVRVVDGRLGAAPVPVPAPPPVPVTPGEPYPLSFVEPRGILFTPAPALSVHRRATQHIDRKIVIRTTT